MATPVVPAQPVSLKERRDMHEDHSDSPSDVPSSAASDASSSDASSASPAKVLPAAAQRALAEAAARRAEAAKQDTSKSPKEFQGPSGPEPTRFGDWERKGIASDF